METGKHSLWFTTPGALALEGVAHNRSTLVNSDRCLYDTYIALNDVAFPRAFMVFGLFFFKFILAKSLIQRTSLVAQNKTNSF
jgi:hypothetical protein